jgi:hypothetical protein
MRASVKSKVVLVSVVVFFAAAFASSCGKDSGSMGNQSGGTPQSSASSRSLDLIFEGTWAFVVGADGSVTAYTPNLTDHSKPYIRGVDEQQLPQGQYSLSIDKYLSPSRTDYDSTAPHNEFKLSYTKPIATGGAEYLSMHLPKPTSFIHMHLDPQQFENADPGNAFATNPVPYPTIMALRYDLSDITTAALSCANNCLQSYSPDIPILGNEQLLVVEVDPLAPDNDSHTHAKAAFQALISLFPEFKLWIAFPAPPPSIGASKAGNKPSVVSGPGKDCRASLLLLQPK